jgi:hypothetical protein
VHTSLCQSLNFSMMFFQRDVRNIGYVDSVSPKLSHWIIRVFHIIAELKPSFFSLSFEGIYMTIGHQLSKESIKNINNNNNDLYV